MDAARSVFGFLKGVNIVNTAKKKNDTMHAM